MIPTLFQSYFKHAKLEEPTPIQAQAWPLALQGHDVLAQAPTGSGKTLAFLLPSVPHIQQATSFAATKPQGSPASPIALILCPTRELAKQVRSVAKAFRRLYGIQSAAVYGGSIDKQIEKCRGDKPIHLLVATPGRLYDLTKRGEVVLSNVSYVVLDEADRLAVNDYEEHLTYVRNCLAVQRQTVMFSATMPPLLEEKLEATWRDASTASGPTQRVMLCSSTHDRKHRKHREDSEDESNDAASTSKEASSDKDNALDDPSEDGGSTAPNHKNSSNFDPATLRSLTQTVHVCAEHKKSKKLIKFLQKIRLPEKKDSARLPALVIVFCNRIKTVLYVKDLICKMYPKCAALHGKMNQEARDQVLINFRAAKTHVLVATDIAARGLDIKHLPIVINWDMPSTIESYVHRVGRAARHQGDQGTAYTFYTRHFHKMARDMIQMLTSTQQKIDPNLIELAERSEAGDKELEGEDNNGEEEIESDAEPTEMPVSFGKNSNLALSANFTPGDWTDSSEEEEEEEEEEGGEDVVVAAVVKVEQGERLEERDGDQEVDQEVEGVEGANARPDSVPKGGKGSYRELCKQDFKRAAWLAGKASSTKTNEKNTEDAESRQQDGDGDGGGKDSGKDGKKKRKGGLKRPRGRRGGKKNRKGGGAAGGGGGGNGGPYAKKQRFNNKKERKFGGGNSNGSKSVQNSTKF